MPMFVPDLPEDHETLDDLLLRLLPAKRSLNEWLQSRGFTDSDIRILRRARCGANSPTLSTIKHWSKLLGTPAQEVKRAAERSHAAVHG